MGKLTICMISVDFLPNIGGIATHVYEMSKALIGQGHKVHVLNIRYGFGADRIEEIDRIIVHRLVVKRKFKKVRFLFWLWRGKKYLQSLLASERIDILHWHGLFNDSYLTKFVYSNCVKVFTNHSSTYLKMVNAPLKRTYLKWLLSHADLIIAPSEELALKSRVVTFPKKIEYIPNGVDPEKFNPNIKRRDIRTLYSIPKNSLILLCPRRLDPKNGIEYLIRSAPDVLKKYNNVYFLIVGNGNAKHKEYLQRLAREQGIGNNVIFAGSIVNTEMPEYYLNSDIIVLPSLVEATSIAGLEGMACAKPIIGTKTGGIPEIASDGKNSLLVEPANSQGLAQAILVLLKDEDKRKKFGLKGREFVVRRFDWKVIAQKTVEVYNGLIESKR
jgi:glycosyltransferase involved in cell wall biosynthesis